MNNNVKTNSKKFLSGLKGDFTERLFLFLGEEEGEKDKTVARLSSLYTGTSETQPGVRANFHMDHGKGNPNEELVAAAEFVLSPSMFDPKRICVVRNIEFLKSTAPNKHLVQQMIEERDESVILILTSLKNTQPSIITAELQKTITTVQFWRYFDRDIRTYLGAELKKMAMRYEEDAVTSLIEKTGRDIQKIDQALQMIRFSGESTVLTVDMVSNLVQDVRSVSIFQFVDNLFTLSGNALGDIRRILDEGASELYILAMIARQAESLALFHSFRKQGQDIEEALKNSGVRQRNSENFLRMATVCSPEKLSRIFFLIARADYQLKSRRISAAIIANPVFLLVSDLLTAA